MKDKKAVPVGPYCIGCGHCEAACAQLAINVSFLNKDALDFSTFKPDTGWIKHGEFDVAKLVQFMQSRRSCRNFKKTPIDKNIFEDLVKIGTTAPSGSNKQVWTFTILENDSAVKKLGALVADFFEKTNKLASKSYARLFARIFLNDLLGKYYREYYVQVKEALIEYRDKGIDRLFFNAPSVILIGSKPGGSTPLEDAILASQNIQLAAHAMGLGTCMIGFAIEAIKNDKTIKKSLGIPGNEKIHAVIAIGFPKEKYERTVWRKKVVPRFIS